MTSAIKIATCCYCSAKTVMALDRIGKQDLVCSSCSAPLSEMEFVSPPQEQVKPSKPKPQKETREFEYSKPRKSESKKKKKKKKRGLFGKLVDEAFDAIEDIFD